MGVVVDTDRHHDGRSLHRTAVLQRQEKELVPAFDRRHIGFVDLGDGMLLKPEPVLDEHLSRHRIARVIPGLADEPIECILPARIRQDGGPPVGTQKHSVGHVVPPQLEGPAENSGSDPSPEEVSGRRQTVRSGSDNYGVILHENFFPRLTVFFSRPAARNRARCLV